MCHFILKVLHVVTASICLRHYQQLIMSKGTSQVASDSETGRNRHYLLSNQQQVHKLDDGRSKGRRSRSDFLPPGD